MARARRLLLLGLLAVAAQQLALQQIEAQGFPVSGRVIDASTGRPVAHATLSIAPLAAHPSDAEDGESSPYQGNMGDRERGGRLPGGENRRAGNTVPPPLGNLTTGADGSFLFAAVPAGIYQLTAARRGYAPASLDQHGSFFAAVVAGPRAQATGLRFLLEPDATIEGTVLDSSGDPVGGASITLFRQGWDGTGTIRQVRSTFLQQGDSSYAFSDLVPGTYFLSVSGRPWFAESRSGNGEPDPLDLAYPITFFSGADSSAAAQPIILQAGDDARADMMLHAVAAVHVQMTSSSVFSAPSLSEAAFSGTLPLPTWGMTIRGSSIPGGPRMVSISVAPGTYRVRSGGRETTLDATADTTLPAADASPPQPASVTGRVAMANGSPLPRGISLQLTPARDSRYGGVVFSGGFHGRLGGGPHFAERPVDVPLQPDGSFRADAVSPDDYSIGVEPNGHDPILVTGAAASGAPISGSFTLHVGSDPVMLAATVALASSTIRGEVVDEHGAPEAGVMVLLIPSDPTATALFRQEESNSDGSWSLDSVPAAAYRVLAIRDGWDLAWKKPGVLARYLPAAIPVQIPENANLTMSRPVPAQPR